MSGNQRFWGKVQRPVKECGGISRGFHESSLAFPLGFIAKYSGILLVTPKVKGASSSSTPAKEATNLHLRARVPNPYKRRSDMIRDCVLHSEFRFFAQKIDFFS